MQTVDLQPDTHYYISMMVKLLNQSDDVTGEVVKLNYNYDGRTRLSTRTHAASIAPAVCGLTYSNNIMSLHRSRCV